MKYAVGFLNKETDATVILEDGGIVTVHHNGEHLISTYYQDRLESYNLESLSTLCEGKVHLKDWQYKQVIDEEVIQDAIGWLCPFCDEFSKVSWNEIINQINNSQ